MHQGDRRTAVWLFLCCLFLYVLSSGGHFYASDDQQKLAVLQALHAHGTFAIEGGWVQGLGHLTYSWFPLGASLLMVPGYLVGVALQGVFPMLPGEQVLRFAIAMQNAVLSAGIVTLVFIYLRWLGRSAPVAIATAAALALGTMVWPYAKSAWSEPGATLFAFGALFALQLGLRSARPVRWWLTAGVLLASAAAIRQELALLAPGVLAFVAWQSRHRPRALASAMIALGAPLAAAALLAVWYDGVRYGAYFTFPNYQLPQSYLQMSEGRPIWALKNLYRYTMSLNQGALWYSPALVLGLLGLRAFWREQRATAVLWLLALAPLGLFYVYGWGTSSWAWGLRYTYPFLPFLLVPAAWFISRQRRSLVVAVLGLGVAVQALGVVHDYNRLYERELAAHPGLTIQGIVSEPAHAPLWLALKATPETLVNGYRLVTVPQPPAQTVEDYQQRRRHLPDLWYVLQCLSPLPRPLTGGAVLLMLAALGLSCHGLRRSIVPRPKPLEAPRAEHVAGRSA